MSKLELGQKVRFGKRLERINVTPRPSRGRFTAYEWQPVPIESTEGVVVGTRTVYNGRSVWQPEEGGYFVQEKSVPAVLVSFNMRKAPIYVHPDDLEIIE